MSPLPSTSSHAPRSGARAWGRACGWIAALSIAACGGAWAAEAPPATARAEQGGLALQLSLQPAGKEPGRYLARLSFSDAGSGAPLPGLQPAAWMQQLRSPAELELPCEDRARRFVAGSLGSRADVDLNTYHLVSLNQDRTLHFINPLVRIRNSRMEATVQLSGDGFDWVHDADTHQLAVTLRDAGRRMHCRASGLSVEFERLVAGQRFGFRRFDDGDDRAFGRVAQSRVTEFPHDL